VLENRNDLPDQPGIYIFKTAAGKVLYIGKAVSLKKRVAQYFQKKDNPLLQNLLQRAAKLDYIVTDAEADALLLEYNLVHTYQPPFNIRLKDDKSFPFIQITLNEEFPGIYYSRQVDSGHFGLGPLVSSKKTKDLIDAVSRLFRLRTCANSIFKKGVPCIYYHIERCSAPCAGKIDQAGYRRQVEDALDFFRNRKQKIALKLKSRMRHLSAQLKFEAAQKLKEDLELLEKFSLRSYISTRSRKDYDVLASCSLGYEAFFIFFAVTHGHIRKSEYFNLPTVNHAEDDVLKEFMLDFYYRRPLPGEIIVSLRPAQAEGLSRFFSTRAHRRVLIRTPRQGKKRKILDLALKNLALFVQRSDYRFLGEAIREQLHLLHFPSHIEGYDVSHLAEKNRVGAMVVFKNGRPEKRLYRNFIIHSAAAGDTEALKEMLRRRFAGASEQPDLLFIDGGLPQLTVAQQIKKAMGLRSDLLALAKKEERIFMEDRSSLQLVPGSPARHLFQNIRDEAHRRAVGHHRRRREKIPG
jgi:excinuclease ABC subunit C